MNESSQLDFKHGEPTLREGRLAIFNGTPVVPAPFVPLFHPDLKRAGVRHMAPKRFVPADSQEKNLGPFVALTFPRMLELRTANEDYECTDPATEFKYIAEPDTPVFHQRAQYNPGIVSGEVLDRAVVKEVYRDTDRFYCSGKGPAECVYCAAREAMKPAEVKQ